MHWSRGTSCPLISPNRKSPSKRVKFYIGKSKNTDIPPKSKSPLYHTGKLAQAVFISSMPWSLALLQLLSPSLPCISKAEAASGALLWDPAKLPPSTQQLLLIPKLWLRWEATEQTTDKSDCKAHMYRPSMISVILLKLAMVWEKPNYDSTCEDFSVLGMNKKYLNIVYVPVYKVDWGLRTKQKEKKHQKRGKKSRSNKQINLKQFFFDAFSFWRNQQILGLFCACFHKFKSTILLFQHLSLWLYPSILRWIQIV